MARATTKEVAAGGRNSGGARWAQYGYAVLAGLFFAGVLVQVYLAGMGVFLGPENWPRHTTFIHAIELLPLLMFPLAFVGRLPTALRWHPVVFWLLIALQYATAGMARSPDARMMAALHPVVALLIFWLALTTTRRAWRLATTPPDPTSRSG